MPLPIQQPKLLPPRIMIYGPPGIGKTTLASKAPKCLFIPVEDGCDELGVDALPRPQNWTAFINLLELFLQDNQGYHTLAIDSITAVETLACKAVSTENNSESVEGIPYKGYAEVATKLRKMLDLLSAIRSGGVAVILVGHLATVKYEDPRSAGYDRFMPRLDRRVLPIITEWCDIVACANYQVFVSKEGNKSKGIGEGERVLYLEERPTHLAKNRYSLPPEVAFSWAPIFQGIAEFRKKMNRKSELTNQQTVVTAQQEGQ